MEIIKTTHIKPLAITQILIQINKKHLPLYKKQFQNPIVSDNFKKYSMKTNPKTNILLIEYFKQKRRQFLLKLEIFDVFLSHHFQP